MHNMMMTIHPNLHSTFITITCIYFNPESKYFRIPRSISLASRISFLFLRKTKQENTYYIVVLTDLGEIHAHTCINVKVTLTGDKMR